jgi:hypothetical protein
MQFLRTTLFASAVAASLSAQVVAGFECQSVGAMPSLAGPADCEGLLSNGIFPGLVSVSATATCGFPVAGAKHAVLNGQSTPGVNMVAGQILARPLVGLMTELRVPLGGGVVAAELAYAFEQTEGANSDFNDGFDVSVVDAAGNRLALVARGDTFSFGVGCSGVRNGRATFPRTPAGAYLSIVVYNETDTATAPKLRVDAVVIDRNIGFECQAPGSSFTATPDCEGVVGQAGTGGFVAVTSGAACGLPTRGVGAARISAGGFPAAFVAGGTVARPLPSTFAEIRIPVPAGATAVSFDYAFNNGEASFETTYLDGFDVSVVDAAGNRTQLLVKNDVSALPVGCGAIFRFVGAISVPNPGFFLSFTAFNGVDTASDSSLYVDDVCFSGAPRLTYFSPLGQGSLGARIECGTPGALYYTPVTLAPGAFPFGAFFGVDISVFDIFLQFASGAPFVGVLDSVGVYDMPPFTGLPSGLTLYANVIVNIGSPSPDVGTPISYTIP